MVKKLKMSSKGQGERLVLIHGWGMNDGIWQPLIDILSKRFNVISFDLPGFADNRSIELSPYSIDEISQLVSAEIKQPAYYLGWSLGGLIATHMALNVPDRVKGLITVASSPCFLQKLQWPGIKPEVLKSFHQQLKQDAAKTIEGFLKIQAMGSPHIRQDIKVIRNLVMQKPMASTNTLDKSLSLLETTDLREQLSHVQQPFLRLYGRLDSLVPKQAIDLINQLAPKSDYHVFEKSSHAPFITALEEFSTILSQWFSRQESLNCTVGSM
jgi:pimeloyl-[acyl-carrier protein] methyl ester esterase